MCHYSIRAGFGSAFPIREGPNAREDPYHIWYGRRICAMAFTLFSNGGVYDDNHLFYLIKRIILGT